MATKFTKSNVGTLAPRANTFIEWDTETRGLGLLITKAGARSWVVQYRTEGGRTVAVPPHDNRPGRR